MHHLLREPVVNITRTAINVDCRREEEQPQRFVAEEGEVRANKSLLQQYKTRGLELAGVTYFEWLTKYDWRQSPPRIRPRAKDRVLVYFPKYKPDGSKHKEFYRVKLMLHHPFTDIADLLMVNGMAYVSFAEAYYACTRFHHDAHPFDYYSLNEAPVNDDEFEEEDFPAEEEAGT